MAKKEGDEAISKELQELELEERKLRLEDLRNRVEAERARRETILRASKMQQDELDKANKAIIAGQKTCKHRKGGKGLEGISNGNDSNHSVIKHVHACGEIQVMCTRCNKEWWPPLSTWQQTHDPEAFAAAQKSSVELARQHEEYKRAVDMPTDNETSGTQLFIITRAPQRAAS